MGNGFRLSKLIPFLFVIKLEVEFMGKYILKRIIQSILILIVISIVSFILVKMAPGDPVKAYNPRITNPADIAIIRHNLGLDKPLYIQYFIWIGNVLKGDLGYSLVNYRPVTQQIAERIPATLALMGVSFVISIIAGIVLGLLSAFYRNKIVDEVISIFSYIGISIPAFWFAMILIVFVSGKMGLFPSVGMRTIGVDSTVDLLKHFVLPSLVLSVQNTAIITRYIRANAISQMKEDYVRTAISKGLTRGKVFSRHVLRNILLPIVTILGMSLPELISGAFITETIFGWPGMGRLGINAIFSFDYPLIMAITMLSAVMVIIGNLLSDILYSVVDPRVKVVK